MFPCLFVVVVLVSVFILVPVFVLISNLYFSCACIGVGFEFVCFFATVFFVCVIEVFMFWALLFVRFVSMVVGLILGVMLGFVVVVCCARANGCCVVVNVLL